MKIWFSPWAAVTFLALLHFLALMMFYNVLKNFMGPAWSLTGLMIFFWLNPWRLSEVFLWNPGYIYFASLVHMWSAFHLSRKKSFGFSLLHCLSLFLGLQIHPSFIILCFMTMILLWMKALKPHFPGVFVGILMGLLSLTPYFLAGLEDPSLFPQMGGENKKGHLFFGLLHIYPLLKGVWYWILFGSNIFQTHVFHQLEFSWIGQPHLEKIFILLWTLVKYGLGLLGVMLSFYINFIFFKSHKQKMNILSYKMKKPEDWLPIYTLTAFMAAFVCTALSPTLPIYWHLLYIWPMAIIPLLLQFDQWITDQKWAGHIKKYILTLVAYFCMTNFLAAMGSKKHDIGKAFHDHYFEICLDHCSLD